MAMKAFSHCGHCKDWERRYLVGETLRDLAKRDHESRVPGAPM